MAMSNLTEIPSDYSHLVDRMQNVYKQFVTNETFAVATTGVDKVLGPIASIEIQNRRMLVVDD